MPIRSEFDSQDDYESKVRERYAMILNAIATRIQMRGSDGTFAYWIPSSLHAVLHQNNLDYMLALHCQDEQWESRNE